MGSPVDKEVQDALDRLVLDIARLATNGTIVCEWCNASDVTDDAHRSGCPVPEIEGRLATVRRSLEQLREERDAAQRMADHMVTLDGPNAWAIANAERHRAEAAEAEVQRYREGLREAVDMIRFPCAECKPFIDKARALLAAPAGEHAEGEGGEA